jgi:hypothetical protein
MRPVADSLAFEGVRSAAFPSLTARVFLAVCASTLTASFLLAALWGSSRHWRCRADHLPRIDVLSRGRRNGRHRLGLAPASDLFRITFRLGVRRRSCPLHVDRLTINDFGIRQLQFGDQLSRTDKTWRRSNPGIREIRRG